MDPKNKISSTVRVGNIVTFMKVPGEEESYTIVGTLEVNPIEHKSLIESPIGKSLLGNKIK